MAAVICDFCSSTPVTWRYPTASFTLGVVGFDGDWAACDVCHVLLVHNDRVGLLRRSVDLSATYLAELPEELRWDMIRPVHREFFKHQQGPGVPHVE